MDSVISQMLSAYHAQGRVEQDHALKEIMQEIVLCGLARAGFFKEAAFYGGTALRIFHGLDRFSEDMDFSLLNPNTDFSLQDYCGMLEREVNAFGLDVEIQQKVKTRDSDIQSAFLKANTLEHMLLFYGDENITGIPKSQVTKIKIEIDVNPPALATFEHKYRLLPAPFEVNMYDKPSLFAGKIHAVLCRAWKNRVKGRDLYDYVFYLSNKVPANLGHLQQRLIQSGFIEADQDCGPDDIKRFLAERFESIDFDQARQDAFPFIKDVRVLDVWKPEFFMQITDSLTFV